MNNDNTDFKKFIFQPLILLQFHIRVTKGEELS